MIDLRKEFAKITRNYGVSVYLQRRIYRYRDEIPLEERDNFNFYNKKLEKYKVRFRLAGRIVSLTNAAEERIEGVVNTVDRAYYFPHYAHPKEGDRIYHGDVRFPDKMETYTIDYAIPMPGWKGRIEFYSVGATRESPN